MKTDRELLELAARAAGLALADEVDSYIPGIRALWIVGAGGQDAVWQPMSDDGDAFRLAHKVGLRVDMHYCAGVPGNVGVGVWLPSSKSLHPPFWQIDKRNPLGAARCTIVRAAAEIGRQMAESSSDKPQKETA